MQQHEQESQHESQKRRLSSLTKPISPPPRTRPSPSKSKSTSTVTSLSALEAGQTTTDNHLQTISAHLRKYAPHPPHHTNNNHQHSTPNPPSHSLPIIPLDAWSALYTTNLHPTGHHFVIHQHDHPIAGPHYDLRLQISTSSSVSWAIMYGLPGDPNSRRLNRNATETRVHCLWNHLIETGSAKTGSMIIWDTGVYEILPGKAAPRAPETESDTDTASIASDANGQTGPTESEKLRQAFQNVHTYPFPSSVFTFSKDNLLIALAHMGIQHKINLRLHGTRLPKNYTVFLRRDKTDFKSPATPSSLSGSPKKKRWRVGMKRQKHAEPSSTSGTDTDTDPGVEADQSRKRKREPGNHTEGVDDHSHAHAEHSDADANTNQTTSDYLIRLNNAYPGAVNDIGSVHQRRWFIGLDRLGCGFVAERQPDGSRGVTRRWVRGVDKGTGELGGFEPFYVRGPAVERSVITGRLGADVLRDEGVEGFVPRKGWTAVTY
ncbi:DNA polymerase ligase-domain-containing protein [Aspergillus heterothallicus]